jgi:hypothetical protein
MLNSVHFLKGPENWMMMTSQEGYGIWRQLFMLMDVKMSITNLYLESSLVK